MDLSRVRRALEGMYMPNAAPLLSGLLFFLLGTVAGSFSSVLHHRLPRGESIVAPRSHCTHCRQTLGPLDLVPILSYIWLRGRCRQCQVAIAWRYPLLELACGLSAVLCDRLGGWHTGVAFLGLWVAAHGALGVLRRRSLLRSESGTTLVEVLVSALLLAMVAGPMLTSIQASQKSELYARRRSYMVGLAREGMARAAFQAAQMTAGGLVQGTWVEGQYTITIPPTADQVVDGVHVWRVSVRVTCDCDQDTAANQVTLNGVLTNGP